MSKLAVDALIVKNNKIVLVKRKYEPFKNFYALPGGLVNKETIKQALVREVKEETNLEIEPIRIIGIYDNPNRDIRGIISIAWFCKLVKGKVEIGNEVSDVKFFDLNKLPRLAFDHNKIIKDGMKFVKPKKVLVGGCFDLLHAGHLHFLKKAKALGDCLIVILANDKNVLKDKKRLIFSAEERKKILESLNFVNKVRIGYANDKLKIVKEEMPDIIALGYNQKIDEEKLNKELKKRGLKCKVVRIKSKLKDYSTNKIFKKLI